MIDRKWIGHALPASVLPIERSRLRFFAKAIGETDPVYTDAAAAHDAGYPDLPAPPTFLFAAELDSGVLDRLLADLQIPIARLLHGEQSFSFHRPACVGDTVTVRSTIDDIYDKKNGALEFVVKTARATNQRDELVAELRTVIVCRN
ncbi:MaoC family dehydratase N-terminal domain-containing protein [Variovorax sp. PBL-E5]|uniref:MaoC family dehydratase N-terminal domain-containing protein n=1 Tax=Variovorax sp. PBL-E5 TaxID=434014 RepID=UPI001318A70E|nr:MaoC family dehydratase N-terminal domain-containing protein [Variovorax sp. PBL-E5]VTU32800.1 (3R)-hydroxyacyl-ACP dehydratase subunit HadC [Variovorax sp. PBL-E5]